MFTIAIFLILQKKYKFSVGIRSTKISISSIPGGLPQHFLLEVYDSTTGVLLANVSAKFPVFIVSGLDPGKMLKMIIYASNSKGQSEQVPLDGFTLNIAEKQTGKQIILPFSFLYCFLLN